MKRMIGKHPIDLRDENKCLSQFDSFPGKTLPSNSACYETCRYILYTFYGLSKSTSGNDGKQFYTAKGKRSSQDRNEQSSYIEIDKAVAKESIQYIDRQLEMGYPILVGVDHTYNYRDGINEGTTDHFVVVVGRGSDNIGDFYYFYEVGKSNKDYIMHNNNKLYIKDDHSLQGSPAHNGNRTYIVTQIRINR